MQYGVERLKLSKKMTYMTYMTHRAQSTAFCALRMAAWLTQAL